MVQPLRAPMPEMMTASATRFPAHEPPPAIELAADEHPFYVASQYHPEFKSRPERPAPLFFEFVGAALERSELSPGGDGHRVGGGRNISISRSVGT